MFWITYNILEGKHGHLTSIIPANQPLRPRTHPQVRALRTPLRIRHEE